MIYKKDGVYYLKIGNLYYVADVVLKPHNVVVIPTSEYVETLEGKVIEMTYQELKESLIGNDQ